MIHSPKIITLNRITIIALLIITGIYSSRKPVEHHTPKLLLDLQQSAVSINNIDSADVVFRKVGTGTRVKSKLVKMDSQLGASLAQLTPGTWNADIEIYTKTVNQSSHMYSMIKAILIEEEKTDITWAGPGATSGNGWLKRNVKVSTNNEVAVIVPEEVYDSYFAFHIRTSGKLAFGITREAININYMVDQKSWACHNNCWDADGRLINIDHFMSFTQAILSSPWTRNEISIAVLNEKTETILEYDRTWNQ